MLCECMERPVASNALVLMARVVDGDGLPLSPSQVERIAYSIRVENVEALSSGVCLSECHDEPLDVAEVLRGSLSLKGWEIDSAGHNFRHVLRLPSRMALDGTEIRYEVCYRLVLREVAEPINLRFIVRKKSYE